MASSLSPLEWLAVAALGRWSRSTNALAASTKFDINLGAATKLRVVALVAHNLVLPPPSESAARRHFASMFTTPDHQR